MGGFQHNHSHKPVGFKLILVVHLHNVSFVYGLPVAQGNVPENV